MRRIVPIVEGYGDNAAFPHLIAKLGLHFDLQLISTTPIRVGEWKKLARIGELERALELAHRRNCDHILVALDLDDGCAVTEGNSVQDRIETWKNGRQIDVSLVFLIREYESLFLFSAESFSEDAALVSESIKFAEASRDAKRMLRKLTKRRYKETQDQAEYTKRLNLQLLLQRCRSFRKLAKDLTGLSYDQLL